MKKVFTAIVLMLAICSSCSDKHEVTAEQLTQFYKGYISPNVDNNRMTELKDENLTKQAYEKIGRSATSTGADQLIRAQDINRSAWRTVEATHLEDDWYMVSYFWVRDDSSTLTQIPMKALTVDGKLQITYVPHSLNDSKYGDDLLGCPTRTQISDISQASELEFLESFMDVYLSLHYEFRSLSKSKRATRSLFL